PDVYTKPEVNELLNEKADKTDLEDYYSKSETYARDEVYSKNETNTLFDQKVNEAALDDYYTKFETYIKFEVYNITETDQKLGLKVEKIDFNEYFSKSEDDAMLLLKADKIDLIDSYAKSEDDVLQLLNNSKANLIDSQTKTEINQKLELKADKTDLIESYTISEDQAMLLLKVNKTYLISSYYKSEDDAMLLLKADRTDSHNVSDLSSAQTISGQKQFAKISVQSVSKLSKNDASILLAGDGDMQVSSLVTQPQLQEIRDIATGKSKGFVFSTQEELNDWMAIQDNVTNLAIEYYLHIVDKEVTEYWWDGNDLKLLETELSVMNNVIATLGVATGSDNAITDLSINGNALTSAKNTSFATTRFDQSITRTKTIAITIISNGIQYS
ncbi:MAG: hypothetical protein EZS28_036308, partial [Streblomastix strix]